MSFAQQEIGQGSTITISSIDGSYSEENINDGSTEFDQESKTGLTRTMQGQFQWIQFDLGSKYDLTKVVFHCPANVQDGLDVAIYNNDLIVVVSDDPKFKGVYNPKEVAQYLPQQWIQLNTTRFGANTTPINQKLEGRYVRIWDLYTGGITATEIEIHGKVSASAAREAVASGDAQATIDLIKAGGTVDAEQALKLAVDKRNTELVQAVFSTSRYVPASVITHAIKSGAPSSITNTLLSGDVEINATVADAAVRSKDEKLVAKILTKKSAAFTINHAELAFGQGQKKMGLDILEKANLTANRNMLQNAVYKGDMVLAGELITYGAKPDAGMLNTAIKDNNTPLITLLNNHVKPNSETFQILAKNGDYEQFLEFTAENTLPDNRAVEIAIDKGDTKILKLALKKGGKLNPAMDYAISKENMGMIEFLVDFKGADVNKAIPFVVVNSKKELLNRILNEKNGDAELALKTAITNNKTDMAIIALETGNTNPTQYLAPAVRNRNDVLAKSIVDNGGDPNPGMLPAIENNNVALVEYFLTHGASVSKPQLMEKAAWGEKMEIVRMLIDKGADANNGVNSASGSGSLNVLTYLLGKGADPDRGMASAAKAGHDQIIQTLLDAGGQPDKGIEAAIDNNKTRCAIILLDAGADATVPEYIAKASGKNNLLLVERLVDAGADVDNGLGYAVHYDAVKVLKYLVENGGDLHDSDYMKVAVKQISIGVIPIIAESGLDMNEKVYNEGYSYLHHAIATTSNTNLSSALINAGAEVNAVDNAKETPLHYAARRGKQDKGYFNIVELLMEKGAEINPRNNSGDTPRKVGKPKKMRNLLKNYGGVK